MSVHILKGTVFTPKFDKLSVGEFLFSRAQKYEDNICHLDAGLNISETYGSVKKRSIQVAINLRDKGITHKDVICTCSPNTIDNTIPIIASLFLGAKIANLDPCLSVRNTSHLIQLVAPRIIFVEEESVNLIEKSLTETKINAEIVVFGKSTKYATFSDFVQPSLYENDFKPAKVNIHDIVIMFFSSGTTGLPKAICHSHYGFLQGIEILFHSRYVSNKTLHFTSMYWISGLSLVFRNFLDGSTRVFARDMKGEKTLQMVEKYQLQSLFMAPILTYELTAVPDPERYDLSSLKYLCTGGTTISANQYKKLSQLFPEVKILVGYGMSELGIVTSFHPENAEYFFKAKIESCGKVAPQSLIKVVDIDTENVLSANQKGEIRIKCPGLMKGYYGADSSSCFDNEGFLKTGDIGYYDEDGDFYLIERIKEMFKYKSWHIVPSSIEKILMEHPAIKECAVFGIPRGADGEIPAACVVSINNYNLDKEEIETFVAERVSDTEKLRGGVIFVQSLPRTPTGKLIRKEIRSTVIETA